MTYTATFFAPGYLWELHVFLDPRHHVSCPLLTRIKDRYRRTGTIGCYPWFLVERCQQVRPIPPPPQKISAEWEPQLLEGTECARSSPQDLANQLPVPIPKRATCNPYTALKSWAGSRKQAVQGQSLFFPLEVFTSDLCYAISETIIPANEPLLNRWGESVL